MLATLPASVVRPRYAPAQHGVGIVHLGLGAFHRAHQAVYVDDCLTREGGDWRILAASLRSPASPDALRAQDGLYTVAVDDGQAIARRVIGAIADAVHAPREPERLLAALASPATKLVTLTVTEKGYCHRPGDGALDEEHPDIRHDLAAAEASRSVPGLLAAGLRLRRDGGGPVTILSCDNLADNGALLRRVLLDFAGRRDAGLARWIEREVAFPRSVVDRIVPATTPEQIARLDAECGYRDEALVVSEPFTQWVVEDRFATPMPDLTAAGVHIVPDVALYARAKLRMLNAAHSLLAYAGLLDGCTFVHEAVARPALRDAARRLMLEEAAPLLGLGAGFDAVGYADALLARFGNPALAHRLEQIACDGSQKLPERIVPTLAANLERGGPTAAAALTVASWIGVSSARARQRAFPGVRDAMDGQLLPLLAGADDPTASTLALAPVFGTLAGDPRLYRAIGHSTGSSRD